MGGFGHQDEARLFPSLVRKQRRPLIAAYLINVFGNAVFVERVDEIGSGQEFVCLSHKSRFSVDFGNSHIHVENTWNVQFHQMQVLANLK